MDLLGVFTYLFVGFEWIDLVWAPFSTYIFYRTFGGIVGKVGGVINFLEELTPLTDAIPTFTICYYYLCWQEQLGNRKGILGQ